MQRALSDLTLSSGLAMPGPPGKMPGSTSGKMPDATGAVPGMRPREAQGRENS